MRVGLAGKLPANFPVGLSMHVNRLGRPLTAFLKKYRSQLHILGKAEPVLSALKLESQALRRQLRANFLGLALGGSVARGLGTAATSDIDYYIYVDQLGAAQAEDIKQQSWQRLRIAELAPCDGNPVVELNTRPLLVPARPLAVFTNYFVCCSDLGRLKLLAVAVLESLLRPEEGRAETQAFLREEYTALVGGRADRVIVKFLQNIAREDIPEEQAITLSHNQMALDYLVKIAEPAVSARVRRFPFPAELAAIDRMKFRRKGSEKEA